MEKTVVISTIIPVYNAATTIGTCLEALRGQSVAWQSEVIVVDDGSHDETREVVQRDPGVKLVCQAHGGPALARNWGAAEAQGQVLLFTDADCVPQPDWAERLAQPILAGEAVGTKGTYRTRQRSLVARFVQQEYEEKYARMARERAIDFVDTYAAGYAREVFQAAGGFDAVFPEASVEDQEFSFRLSQQGQRLVFVPEAVVVHRHADTPGRYLRKKFRIGYWKALVMWWYPQKMARDSHTPQSQKVQLIGLPVLVILALLSLLWPPGSWIWGAVAITYALSMGPLLARVARRDPPVLWVAPLLILARALALGAGFACGVLRFWFRGEAC